MRGGVKAVSGKLKSSACSATEQVTRELAAVKKSIYSLIDLREILLGCNRRYLEYLSALDDFSAGSRSLDKLTMPKDIDGHRVKGFNFFDKTEHSLLCSLQRPQFNIRGVRRADLKPFLPICPSPVSPAISDACATSASSRKSPAPIATTSPASAVAPSPPPAESPSSSSSRLSPYDKICSEYAKSKVVTD